MTPIFFPFTYLSTGVADILCTCFHEMILLQPVPGRIPAEMEKLQASGWLDARAPLNIDAARLQTVIKGYRSWAELNLGSRGLDTGSFQFVGKQFPFFDDTTPSRIRDAIRKQGRGGAGEENAPILFPDLVFLSMAEQFDIQTQSVSQDFEGIAGMEADLFDRLKGENNGMKWPMTGKHGGGSGASEEHMLSERLAAWRRLMAASFTDKKMPAVAVTTSRSAVDSLSDGFAALDEVACIENVAVCDPAAEDAQRWRKELADYLQDLADGDKPVAGPPPDPPVDIHAHGRLFSMRLYVAAGIDLLKLLSAASGESRPEPPLAGGSSVVVSLITAGHAA